MHVTGEFACMEAMGLIVLSSRFLQHVEVLGEDRCKLRMVDVEIKSSFDLA